MKAKKIRLLFIFLLALLVAYLAIPTVTVTELVYPIRRDSVYMRSQQVMMESKDTTDPEAVKKFLYNPGQLGLAYREMTAISPDSVSLRFWVINDSVFSTGYHLLVIPDMNESRLDYIEFADEATGRGLTVSVADMRGQGVSGGKMYIPGRDAVSDLSLIIDSLQSVFSFDEIAVFGAGSGAAIVLQAALRDVRIGAIILENPFLSMSRYLKDYTVKKYGRASFLFQNRMRKSYFSETGIHPDSLNLEKMISEYDQPVMLISRISKANLDYKSEQRLFQKSPSKSKKWIALRTFDEATDREASLKKYFDRLATFVNVNLPKPVKTKPRYKRVA